MIHREPTVNPTPLDHVVTREEVSVKWERSERSETRRWLPYGFYTRADGSEVLFNRDYCPLWERTSPSSKAVEADHEASIDYVSRTWFFSAGFILGIVYMRQRKACENRALGILRDWGIDEPFLDGEPTQLYRAYDCFGDLLYVGVSFNVIVRMGEHEKDTRWFRDVARIDFPPAVPRWPRKRGPSVRRIRSTTSWENV